MPAPGAALRDNLKLKRQMSRISSFYTPFLKYKHQDVRRAPPRPPRSAPKLTRLASQADRASLPKLTVPRFPTQVELVSPMEHVLNLLRSFHNTLVENGQDVPSWMENMCAYSGGFGGVGEGRGFSLARVETHPTVIPKSQGHQLRGDDLLDRMGRQSQLVNIFSENQNEF